MLAIQTKLQDKSRISLFLFSLMLMSKALPGNPYLDEVTASDQYHQKAGEAQTQRVLELLVEPPETIRFNPLLSR